MFTKEIIWKLATRLSFILVMFGGLVSNANALVSYTFTTDGVGTVIDSRSGSFFSLENELFTITNNTGITWTDFDVALIGFSEFGDYPFMQFADLGAPGIYSGPGTASFSDANADTLGLNEVMTLSGLNILDGDDLSFTVDIFGGIPEGLISFDIYARSRGDGSTPPSGVPEPTILALLVGGLIGIGFVRRKKV